MEVTTDLMRENHPSPASGLIVPPADSTSGDVNVPGPDPNARSQYCSPGPNSDQAIGPAILKSLFC
ncbi:UNVERIFIED_CONTAM: hypothetical protein Sindi_0961600, partial [Sesamum indicum]